MRYPGWACGYSDLYQRDTRWKVMLMGKNAVCPRELQEADENVARAKVLTGTRF
jgi:hypothetical protein